jgi:hypothetical protein
MTTSSPGKSAAHDIMGKTSVALALVGEDAANARRR